MASPETRPEHGPLGRGSRCPPARPAKGIRGLFVWHGLSWGGKHAAGEERARAGRGEQECLLPTQGGGLGRGAASPPARPCGLRLPGGPRGRGRVGRRPEGPRARGAGRRDPPPPRARLRGSAPTPGPRRPRRRQLPARRARRRRRAAGKTRAGAGAERAGGAAAAEVGVARGGRKSRRNVAGYEACSARGGSAPGSRTWSAGRGARRAGPGRNSRSGLGANAPSEGAAGPTAEALYPTQTICGKVIFSRLSPKSRYL